MKRNTGSLTVETALILPIFLFMTIALISFLGMMSAYGRMEAAVHETARETACYSYIVKDIAPGGLLETETVIRAMLWDNYGLNELEKSNIEGGILGIHMFRSEIPDEDDTVDLIVTYKVEPWLNFFDLGSLTFCNRARIHAWNGYSLSDAYKSDEYVYITENGKVYHTNPDCTYLHVSIYTVSGKELDNIRNEDGKKYDKCKLCFDKDAYESGCPIYVTKYGEAYHTSLSCSALKRTVYKVKLSEVGDRTECIRCQNYMTGEEKTDESDNSSGSMLPDNIFSFDY